MNRLLLISTAIALILGPAASAADVEEAERRPAGAAVQWSDGPPPAGSVVKLRLRGELLARLLADKPQWRLAAGAEAVAARLELPAAVPEKLTFELSIDESHPLGGRGAVVLDRGDARVPFDRLALKFAAAELLCAVHVEASADGELFEPLAGPRVVLQRIESGTITRVTELSWQPVAARYLRLVFEGAADVRVTEVEAWQTPPAPADQYELPVALGPVADGPETGEHLWPLLMSDNRVPLVKLKVLANAPGEVRRMRIVRLGSTGEPETTVAAAVWADGLRAGGAERSEKWIIVNEAGGDPRPWGLIVEDGAREALAVTGVQAYAAEAWLFLEVPESPELTMWLGQPPGPELTADSDALAAAPYAGQLSELLEFAAAEGEFAAPGTDWSVLLDGLLKRWGRLAAFGLGGLLAVLIGLMLLRRPRAAH